MKTDDLLFQLKTSNIALFGTGFVAEMFFEALTELGLSSKLCCCIVSSARERETFHGRPVFTADSYSLPEDTVLCVAVHESVAVELNDTLNNISDKRVWIYPNLFELLYGEPVVPFKSVKLSDLLSKQNSEEYWLALRYAAIRDYLKREPNYWRTRELYIKLISFHCSYDTAVRRCRQMEKLADSMAEGGFWDNSPVAVNEHGKIIDGLHRIACAAYLYIDKIPAVVYPESEVYDRLLGKENRLPESLLVNAGVSFSDIQYLKDAMEEMLKR